VIEFFNNLDWENPVVNILVATGGALITALVVFLSIKKFSQVILKKLSRESYSFIQGKLNRPLAFLTFASLLFIPFSILAREYLLVRALAHVMEIIAILSVAFLITRVINIIRLLTVDKIDPNAEDPLDARKVQTQFQIFERIINAVIFFLAIVISLMTFDSVRSIGVSLFASAGVAGIVLGFAAQKLIGTFLAGVQLALTQPIRIDDMVIVENDFGRIEEIHLTYVVVKTWDRRRLVMPSTYFIDKVFQNWSKNSTDILGTIFLYTDYNIPFDAIREKLTELVKDHPLWDGEVAKLQVTNATDRVVESRLLVGARTPPEAWDLRVYVREEIIKFIQKNYPDSLPRTRVALEKQEDNYPGMINDKVNRH
jgi:small-conductance mechanosensitive channel